MDINKVFTERTCPVCGKKIVRASFAEYAYKKDGKVYCGWNCYSKGTSKKKEK